MMEAAGAAQKQRPLVVELVGAWGAGKSSLVRSLVYRDGSVRAAPPVWSLPKPLLAIGGLQVLAVLIRVLSTGERLDWRESRQLMRLRALYHNLELLRRKGSRVVVVEDGPALILSWLRSAAHRSATNGGMAPWWSGVVRRWAKTVDVVVFLDAPETVLTQRVLARPQSNPFKDRPESELAEALERSRTAYGEVLSDLGALDGPPVLAFRTDQQSVAEITEQLMLTLAGQRNGH
jgi:shikimate kinase